MSWFRKEYKAGDIIEMKRDFAPYASKGDKAVLGEQCCSVGTWLADFSGNPKVFAGGKWALHESQFKIAKSQRFTTAWGFKDKKTGELSKCTEETRARARRLRGSNEKVVKVKITEI